LRGATVLILASLAACGGEAVPSPKAVVAVPAAIEPTDSVADYKAELVNDAVQGFVLVPVKGVKWPSLDEARGSKTPVRPSDEVAAHEVVEDHGDVVEILPAHEDYDHHHCHVHAYGSMRRFKVSTFVRKRDVIPVLAEPVSFAGDDDTSYTLQAGSSVVERAGQTLVVPREGLAFPLPPQTKLALSYERVKRLARPRRRSVGRGYGGFELAEPIRVDGDATLKIGRRSFRAGALTSREQLHVDDTSSAGDDALVTLGGDCYRFTARVDADAVHDGYEGRGGGAGIGTIGRGGGGFVGTLGRRGARRPKPPPPKEHYVPAGTPITWRGAGVAGELVSAIVTYPLDEPACEALDQGLVEEQEVCFSAAAVKRDCRTFCKSEGRCDVSEDGDRCVAARTASCAASHGCEHHGRCSLKRGVCVAARDADCQGSLYCRSSPHACMAFEGQCVVTPNPDCANRPVCVTEGKCVADEHGVCVAASAQRCKQSRACKESGACTLRGESCEAASDADCRGSRACMAAGRCEESDGICRVARSADCRASEGCAAEGACAALEVDSPFGGELAVGGFGEHTKPPKHYQCGPATDADCRRSRACRDDERCQRKKTFAGGYRCGQP